MTLWCFFRVVVLELNADAIVLRIAYILDVITDEKQNVFQLSTYL